MGVRGRIIFGTKTNIMHILFNVGSITISLLKSILGKVKAGSATSVFTKDQPLRAVLVVQQELRDL